MESTTNLSPRLPEKISRRLRLPLIAAPMLSVSGPDLVIAACRAGAIGSFPLANARTPEQLEEWLTRIEAALDAGANSGKAPAPFCPNLIIKRPQMRAELAALVKHRVEMVITSVGSPVEAIVPLHDVGCIVFADVASVHHARSCSPAVFPMAPRCSLRKCSDAISPTWEPSSSRPTKAWPRPNTSKCSSTPAWTT